MKPARPAPWSPAEDRLIVTDYLLMLMKQRAGVLFNKSATRRALLPLLNHRSEGSIEMKRMNISAVLADLKLDYITGYKPASNYQRSLQIVVTELLQHTDI